MCTSDKVTNIVDSMMPRPFYVGHFVTGTHWLVTLCY